VATFFYITLTFGQKVVNQQDPSSICIRFKVKVDTNEPDLKKKSILSKII